LMGALEAESDVASIDRQRHANVPLRPGDARAAE